MSVQKNTRPRFTKQESMLICTFVVAFTFFCQMFLFKPKLESLKTTQDKITTVRASILDQKNKLAALSTRMPASEELKTTHQLLDKYLKSNDRFSSVVTNIVASSKEESFLLTKVVSENQAKMSGYIQTLYHLEAETSFISIGKFLERLEDSPLLTEVQSIDIVRLEDEMERCKASIKLFSYVVGGDK